MPDSRNIRKPVDFIVLSAMRSGSNNLQDTLNEHPEIECGGEVFNPKHVQIWSRVYREDQKASQTQRVGLQVVMAVARGKIFRSAGDVDTAGLRIGFRP